MQPERQRRIYTKRPSRLDSIRSHSVLRIQASARAALRYWKAEPIMRSSMLQPQGKSRSAGIPTRTAPLLSACIRRNFRQTQSQTSYPAMQVRPSCHPRMPQKSHRDCMIFTKNGTRERATFFSAARRSEKCGV